MVRKPFRQQVREPVRGSGLSKLILLCGFIMLVLFLWGRVHIDFNLQEIQKLKKKKEALLVRIDDLQIQINSLQQYQRITSLAEAQGFVSVEPSDCSTLVVDCSDLREIEVPRPYGMNVAGFGSAARRGAGAVSPFEKPYAAK